MTRVQDIDDPESKEIECLKRSFVELDPFEVAALRKESVGAQTGLIAVEDLLGRIKDSSDLARRYPEEHAECQQTAVSLPLISALTQVRPPDILLTMLPEKTRWRHQSYPCEISFLPILSFRPTLFTDALDRNVLPTHSVRYSNILGSR